MVSSLTHIHPSVMPSKAALFNNKCEMVFDFGITHRNTALYNPHGNNILNKCTTIYVMYYIVSVILYLLSVNHKGY